MGDYDSIGKAINALFIVCATLLIVFVPLGLWKLIEIIVWCFKHINLTVQ